MKPIPRSQGHRPLPPRSRVLKRGERFLEPDVYVAQVGGRVAVIKDYGRYRRTPVSLLARVLVRREARVLRRLRGQGSRRDHGGGGDRRQAGTGHGAE